MLIASRGVISLYLECVQQDEMVTDGVQVVCDAMELYMHNDCVVENALGVLWNVTKCDTSCQVLALFHTSSPPERPRGLLSQRWAFAIQPLGLGCTFWHAAKMNEGAGQATI